MKIFYFVVVEQNESEGRGDNFTLFKIIAYIGIAGNLIVGVVALYFMASGLTGTHFFTDIEDETVSASFIILSILFFFITSALCLIGIIGLLKMLNRDREGRKLYLIVNLVWIALTCLVLPDSSFYQMGIFSAIYTLVLVFLSRDEFMEKTED
jgi:Ca2+/Na+ antiporter